ncbi:MAG: hypothetical protein QME73_01420 [Bacillota bacterium]|nr:hypothetical protein [Bacillota bacterium]
MVDKEIDQDDLALISTDGKRQIILPRERGYYLFVLRTEKEIQYPPLLYVLKIKYIYCKYLYNGLAV